MEPYPHVLVTLLFWGWTRLVVSIGYSSNNTQRLYEEYIVLWFDFDLCCLRYQRDAMYTTLLLSVENCRLLISVIMFLWFVIIFFWCEKYMIQIMDDSKKYPKWSNGSAEMTKFMTQY